VSVWIPIVLSIVGPLLGLAASWGAMQSRLRDVDRQLYESAGSRKAQGERLEKMQRETDQRIAELRSEIRLLQYALTRGRTLLGLEPVRPPSSALDLPDVPEVIPP
jgi:hypothetical protein